jgi:hypothetical protein
VALVEKSPREAAGKVVYRWARTLSSEDLNGHMDLYAQKLDRFYDRTNVDRNSIRREKQRLLNSNSNGRRQPIRDVSLKEEDGGRLVIAQFRRASSPLLAEDQHGLVTQRLVLKRLATGEWKIIREEVL